MLRFFLDWIFPKQCICCNKEDEFICKNCYSKIKLSHSPIRIFQETHGLIQKFYIPCEYHGNKVLKKSVHLMKYKFYKDISEELAQLFVNLFKKYALPVNTFLIPIPLHKQRLKYRGFNQSHEIAKHISAKCNIPICDLLLRVKETKQQAESTRNQRIKNMKNAFVINPEKSIPKTSKILLIDDICTTLSTLKEAALTLQNNGYKIIFGAALARAETYMELKNNYENRH